MSQAMVPANGAAQMEQSIRFSDEQKRLMLSVYCKGATPAEASALFVMAERRGLDPFAGDCYFVKRQDQWQIQASIDSFRKKAEQTGLYGGQDEPEFDYDSAGKLVAAKVRVYRKDWERPCVGYARFDEYVQTKADGKPNAMWAKMPHSQLQKCAEALALRKAFPTALNKVYTPEEMEQASNTVPYDKETGEIRGEVVRPATDWSIETKGYLSDIEKAGTIDELHLVGDALDQSAKAGMPTDVAIPIARAYRARLEALEAALAAP